MHFFVSVSRALLSWVCRLLLFMPQSKISNFLKREVGKSKLKNLTCLPLSKDIRLCSYYPQLSSLLNLTPLSPVLTEAEEGSTASYDEQIQKLSSVTGLPHEQVHILTLEFTEIFLVNGCALLIVNYLHAQARCSRRKSTISKNWYISLWSRHLFLFRAFYISLDTSFYFLLILN